MAKLGPRTGRFLIGAIGSLGLAGLVVDAMDGVFSFRGHTTNLAEDPGKFWISVFIFGALFGAMLLCAISGAGFKHSVPQSSDDL